MVYSVITEQRVRSFINLYPELANQDNISFRFIRQTKCSDKASAKALFHGIVIQYAPAVVTEKAPENPGASQLFLLRPALSIQRRQSVAGRIFRL